jgi:ABC-2 type transport system ATP-binding protein
MIIMNNEIAIRIENLNKEYVRGVKVLDHVSFDIMKGDIVGYLGPNGSGKTTTIKILTNLLLPTSGKAFINGIDVTREPKKALGSVGALIEVPGIYDYLTPNDLLTYFGKIHGMDKKKIEERIPVVLKKVKLQDWQYKKIGSFSTGMQRRLAISNAILHEPEILILDEPVIGLDPKGIKEIRMMIKQFQKDGMTIFLSSHLIHEVSETCDKVIFLDGSKILDYDTVDSFKNRLKAEKIDIKILGKLTEEDYARIKAFEFVEGFEIVNGIIRLGFDGRPVTSYRILQKLMNSGYKIASFSPQETDLEDYYVSVMSDERGVNNT